jgi:hypothetical protein
MMDDSTIIRLAQEAAHDELAVAVFTVNELGRFADLAFNEQTKTPQADRDVFEFTHICNGVELVCHLYCDEDELLAPNQVPTSMTLECAYHRGEDISHLLADDVVTEIEDAALAQIKENWNDC